ncbi:MAG: arginine--tRNA ligase, partial [Thermoanaerobaculia bacterium]
MLKDYLAEEFSKIFKAYLKNKYNLEVPIYGEEPPSLKLGDISFSFPLKISKFLRISPLEIAKIISEELGEKFHPHKLTFAPPGFLNIFLSREHYCSILQEYGEEKEKKEEKIIIEHTNINPNKAAHIGHLRNAILGDTLSNFYKYLNYNVEVHNYIDNTGVQVADVVLGLLYLEKRDLDFLEREEKLDFFTWDLYARVSKLIEENSEYLNLRNEILKKIEEGGEPESSYAKKLSQKIMECHLKTMERLNIKYDVLPKESEIINAKLWEKTFLMLKEKGAIVFEEEGKRKGCWVLPLKGKEEFKTEEEPDKILVRSNGTVTYTGKDIAYQLWKFGVLEGNFSFKPFYKYSDGKVVYESTTEEGENFGFGRGDIVINVIDVRQSYLQRIVKEALKLLGYERQAENSIHFSYEMVTLSQKLAREMGFEEGKISGRKGIGVKADDFIDLI